MDKQVQRGDIGEAEVLYRAVAPIRRGRRCTYA
jgi:hypothetical protein